MHWILPPVLSRARSAELLPILVPEEQIVPGVEEWHPSVCRECSAGCGVIVRVMEARRRSEGPTGNEAERLETLVDEGVVHNVGELPRSPEPQETLGVDI